METFIQKDKMMKIKIEKLVNKGYGLGFSDSTPVFVPFTVPNDIITAKINFKKGKVIFAKIDEILQKSKHRIEPNCEVFAKCGGCDWLNISYENQLKYKNEVLKEIFHKIEIVPKICVSPQNFNYRNKCFYPVSTDGQIGMYEKLTHDVITHKDCKIQPSFFDELIVIFKDYLQKSKMKIYDEKTGRGNIRYFGIRHSKATNEILIILVTKNRKMPFTNLLVKKLCEKFPNIVGVIQNINPQKSNVILGKDHKVLFGQNYLSEKIGDCQFRLNYNSFFQVNIGTTKLMYDFVKQNIDECSNVIDAYCGVGSIGIFIADKTEKVFGIEIDKNAVLDAEYNAKINGLKNNQFYCANVENKILDLVSSENVDTIIFDPPRKGLDESFRKKIPHKIKKIVYVSCNPVTQMRDFKDLQNDGFKITKMQAFDMFPQTYHIENVAILER